MAQDHDGAERASRVSTLTFTDLTGSTALKTSKGDVAAGAIIDRHRILVINAASRNGGRIVDWAGDGCFLVFETPSAAVQFALEAQRAQREDSELPGLRIGIHMGEVIETRLESGLRVEGLAVDLAARVQSLAAPGQILMSTEVFNNARQRLRAEGGASITWRAHGPYVLKGFDEPIGVGEVGIEGASPLIAPANSEKASRAVQPHEEAAFGWRPAVGLAIPAHQRWRLERQLGTGGFGEVWLAENALSHEQHVFKFCFEPERIRGLKREVVLFRILKQKLGTHEGIARLLDWELETPPYFVEAEYTEGGDLKDWAARQGGLGTVPMQTRLDIVAQVAGALAEAHRAGVLHKDIKPANILIRGSAGAPHAVITDFGIGLLLDPQALKHGAGSTGLTQTLLSGGSSSTSGTSLYLAPELMEGKVPTERSDIYALGVVLYQIVVGDFSRALAPGWERDVSDPLLREDIGACVDGDPGKRFVDCNQLVERLRGLDDRQRIADSALRRQRAWRIALLTAAVVIVVAIAVASAVYARELRHLHEREHWARTEALPKIQNLTERRDFFGAYTLAMEAQKAIPDDPVLAEAIEHCSAKISIHTRPPGARMSYKPYADPDHAWIPVGTTPLDDVRLPDGFYRWRLEVSGYAPREYVEVVQNWQLYGGANLYEPGLSSMADTPAGSILVDGGGCLPGLVGMPLQKSVTLDPYFIDRTEVTNHDYFEFVAAGGYDKPEYWKEPFTRNGAEVSFADSRSAFVDQTGKPGPATWELGRYPTGKDDYPVSGVSWYEAMAYARFRGKMLPTIYHWARAAFTGDEMNFPFSPQVAPLSNFAGSGPAPVGKFQGMGFGGALDIAGNVREWCLNADETGGHYCLGGAWIDIGYASNASVVLSPWDRSPTNGFRCAAMLKGAPVPTELARNINMDRMDYTTVTPVSDDAFAVLRNGFTYTPAATHARVESARKSVAPGIVKDVVTMDDPIGGERLRVHLYLPETFSGRIPVVIFFQGINALYMRSDDDGYVRDMFDFIVRSGRAFAFPEYEGTYSRGSDKKTEAILTTAQGFREFFLNGVKEASRTIDYVSERADLDASKIAFLGFSLGSFTALYGLAVDKRVSVGVLVSSGLSVVKSTYDDPVTNMINYLPRIKQPVIVVSGKYDYTFPVELSQKPLVARLGTPEADKKHVVVDWGHAPLPHLDTMNAIVPWLDKYQPIAK